MLNNIWHALSSNVWPFTVAMIKERNKRNEPVTADSASPDMIAEYQDQV